MAKITRRKKNDDMSEFDDLVGNSHHFTQEMREAMKKIILDGNLEKFLIRMKAIKIMPNGERAICHNATAETRKLYLQHVLKDTPYLYGNGDTDLWEFPYNFFSNLEAACSRMVEEAMLEKKLASLNELPLHETSVI